MESPNVKHISECFVQPHYASQESKQPFYLTPTDLAMLSAHYIQKGILFNKPPEANSPNFLDTLLAKLKYSLSLALVHFYPLAGRLVTKKEQDPHLYLVYVDCSNSPGAKFIHASLDMSISDILSPTDVPLVVQSSFDHDMAVNHDGHTMSLLTAQVTELVDGVFIGLSMNHAVGDGTSYQNEEHIYTQVLLQEHYYYKRIFLIYRHDLSQDSRDVGHFTPAFRDVGHLCRSNTSYWHFFNTWSEIFRAQENNIPLSKISRPPVMERWFPDGHGPIISLPYTSSDEFVDRFESPELRERMFHFSLESIAKLKSKANSECETSKISSFQALSALLWRSISRARGFPPNQETSCRLAANNRARMVPPLSPNYFGNSIHPVKSQPVKAGELLEHGLGWAAWKLHETVVNHNDKWIRGSIEAWLKSPVVYQLGRTFDPYSIMMGSGPRFDMYGNEFGMGKAVALRSGYANKFTGKVTSYPGREAGSIDLEVCLPPAAMTALESDEEFMEAASVPSYD